LGKSSFGRRFKRLFPDTPFPQPVRWEEPANNHLDANLAETVAMFKYHTWYGYPGGMNLTLPGSTDYRDISLIANRVHEANGTALWGLTKEQRAEASRLSQCTQKAKRLGIFRLTKDQLSKNGKKGGTTGGPVQGRRNADNGHLAKIRQLATKSRLAEPLGFRAAILCMVIVCFYCVRYELRWEAHKDRCARFATEFNVKYTSQLPTTIKGWNKWDEDLRDWGNTCFEK
jgi:hypothetical protein